jgi:VWFA-related protein
VRPLTSGRIRMGTSALANLWIFATVLTAQVTGGSPVPPQVGGREPLQEPAFHVTVSLVQVEAVVTGPDGRPVRDLEPADFEIREGGVRQKITHFSWVQVSPPRPDQPKPAVRPRGTSIPPAMPGRQDVHRTIVMMLDDGGTSAQDLVPVISAGRKFVQEQLEPGDLAAVTASRGGMGFYQQFTSDKRQLLAAIDRIGRRPGWSMFNLEVPRGGTGEGGGALPAFTMKQGESGLGYQAPPPNPIGYLAWSLQGMQQVPGRKAIFLFTGNSSFSAPPALIELANRAGVTIHVIDPRGALESVTSSKAPARRLAEQTGGMWASSGPCCLAATMGQLAEQMSGYYLLGYQPDRSRLPIVAGKPFLPVVEVKVLRPGLAVRHKAVPLDPAVTAAKPAPHTREELLQNALWSPFSAGAVRIQLTPMYSASPPDSKTKRRHPVLRTLVAIDGSRFEFSDAPGKEKKLVLDIQAAVFTPEGQPAGYRNRRFTAVVSPARAREISASGASSTVEIPLKDPGPYQVRAAVVLPEARPGKDDGPAVAGSAYEFLEIPDFNQSRMALSSIVLSQPEGQPGGARAPWREFPAGSRVGFSCEIFGAEANSATAGKQDVQLETKLFRQDQLVWSGPPLAVSVDLGTLKPAVTGSLSLPQGLEAGEYSLELVATNRSAAGRNRQAVQWVAITVTGNQF